MQSGLGKALRAAVELAVLDLSNLASSRFWYDNHVVNSNNHVRKSIVMVQLSESHFLPSLVPIYLKGVP